MDRGVIEPCDTDAELDSVQPFLRPNSFSEFVGQSSIISHLGISIQAARERSEALDHVLFYGPPGLGKTTLSKIIALEMNSSIRCISGPMISKPCDLAVILSNIGKNDVLFIDEIHRLNAQTEEFLYSAMEDYVIDLIIGDGPASRIVKVSLPPFTLVGATTRLGLLTNPLKDRFGIQIKIDFYSVEELCLIIKNLQKKLQINVLEEAIIAIASRSRGTPRIAIRLTKRVRDFATVANLDVIDKAIVEKAMNILQINYLGLDALDRRYLAFLNENYYNKAVGLNTIATGLFEDVLTIEQMIEPYLVKIELIEKTSSGRRLTSKGKKVIESF